MSDIQINAQLELIDTLDSENEAFASISLNPTFQWAKIVVTDDQPNANKHRVPIEEFDNIIRTGIFAPIKMTESEISKGHQEAMGKPIGTITQLARVSNKIVALAALWKRERPEDIELLKKMYQDGAPPNVSWELSYADSEIKDNVEDLHGISLNGLTVVSLPAYTGRTQFIAMASEDNDQSDDTDDQSGKEENIVNEEELKQTISDLEAKVKELEDNLSTKEAELTELKAYKQNIEAQELKASRLAEIRKKFEDAKIEKDEQYWDEKAETLLNLDDASLDFMIQELVAFAEKNASASDTEKTKKDIPNFSNVKDTKDLEPKELGRRLREKAKSK
jgi:hypothetical protein